jgi:aspartyl-tRNA(Asn)/glutamyl-tRNA(Gln) amidotransferase subunit A
LNLADCSAHELLKLYRSGGASPLEATRACLDRVARLNPEINAFCLIDETSALESARKSEARWQQHRHRGNRADHPSPGVLEGVPVSIKDLILTRGWPTLRGSRCVDPAQAWDVDAPVTARLREAGAVLLGKTTTPEFGCKGETSSPLSGVTRNPWDRNKTSGGSSGGAAAAVSCGMGPIAIGTDGAGSVRIPASFCGNVGFKPSFGRVPAFPSSPFGSLAHVGPHTLSVSDTALVMNVMKLPDARDWSALPEDTSDYSIGLNDGVRGLRVAYSPRLGYVRTLDPEIESAAESAAKAAQDLGAFVEACDPPIDPPLDLIYGLWAAGAAAIWRGLDASQRVQTDADFRTQAEYGLGISAAQLHQLQLRRAELGSRLRVFMQNFDLLITPSTAVCAFDLAPSTQPPQLDPESMLGWTPFSYPFNLSQQPAISLPSGLNRQGLPTGVQLVGPMFADALVLRAARAMEQALPLVRRAPLA